MLARRWLRTCQRLLCVGGWVGAWGLVRSQSRTRQHLKKNKQTLHTRDAGCWPLKPLYSSQGWRWGLEEGGGQHRQEEQEQGQERAAAAAAATAATGARHCFGSSLSEWTMEETE